MPLNATGSGREGIVHVMGPELGLTQPGMTIVCGDSHTSTHGAFGALAFGIGTSEVEHVLATQTLLQARPKTMRVRFAGELPVRRHREGHGARRDRADRRRRRRRPRDRVRGPGDRGALDGGPDDDLQHVDRGRRPRRAWSRPTTRPSPTSRAARARRRARRGSGRSTTGARCAPMPGAGFDREVEVDVAALVPQVTWGTNPGMVAPIDGRVPDPAAFDDPADREAVERALALHGARAGHAARRDRRSTASSSARARTRASRTCAPRPRSSSGTARRRRRARDGRARLGEGEAPGRGRGPRPRLHDRRLRVARGRLLDVPRHEPGHPRRRASAAPRPRTATSKAARAPAAARISLSPAMAAAAAITGHFTDVRELGDRTVPVHAARGDADCSEGMRRSCGRYGRGGARPRRRRHRPDHPEAVPEADRALGLRRVPVLRLDEGSRASSCAGRSTRARTILVAGRNFGCGSSREHAAWALEDAGFRVVLAPSFGDIFRTNAIKTGLAPIVLAEADARARSRRRSRSENELTVDLEALEISHPERAADRVRVRPVRPAHARRTASTTSALTLQREDADRRLRGGALRPDRHAHARVGESQGRARRRLSPHGLEASRARTPGGGRPRRRRRRRAAPATASSAASAAMSRRARRRPSGRRRACRGETTAAGVSPVLAGGDQARRRSPRGGRGP